MQRWSGRRDSNPIYAGGGAPDTTNATAAPPGAAACRDTAKRRVPILLTSSQ